MMKKVLVIAVITCLSVQQCFGATVEEVQQAYEDFENATTEVLDSIETVVNNITDYFLYNLALERLDGKLTLNARLNETREQIQVLSSWAESYNNINISECVDGMDDYLQTARDNLFESLEICLYDMRYEIGINIITSKWNDIEHLGMNYLNCTQQSIEDCGGDSACGDRIITDITQKKEEALSTLQILGVNLLNILNGFPVRCKDRVLTAFNDELADSVEYVTSCVDRLISSSVPLMCNTSSK